MRKNDRQRETVKNSKWYKRRGRKKGAKKRKEGTYLGATYTFDFFYRDGGDGRR